MKGRRMESRRSFFKKAIIAVVPMLGLTILGIIPVCAQNVLFGCTTCKNICLKYVKGLYYRV